MAREPGDRYEPFPGLTKVPGWVWTRLGRGGRIALGLVGVALVVAVILLIPCCAAQSAGRVARTTQAMNAS